MPPLQMAKLEPNKDDITGVAKVEREKPNRTKSYSKHYCLYISGQEHCSVGKTGASEFPQVMDQLFFSPLLE